jgi:hypothetical protein
VVVIESGAPAGTMVTLKALCALCCGAVSVTRIVKLNVPSAAGVPLITPLDERLSPPGKDPEANDQVYGAVPPVAAKVRE